MKAHLLESQRLEAGRELRGYQKEKGGAAAGGALRGAVAAFDTCDWFSG